MTKEKTNIDKLSEQKEFLCTKCFADDVFGKTLEAAKKDFVKIARENDSKTEIVRQTLDMLSAGEKE